jgi:hypothetical protein
LFLHDVAQNSFFFTLWWCWWEKRIIMYQNEM